MISLQDTKKIKRQSINYEIIVKYAPNVGILYISTTDITSISKPENGFSVTLLHIKLSIV